MALLETGARGLRAIGSGLWLTRMAATGMARRLWMGDPLAQRGLADSLARFVWAPVPTVLALAGLIGVIAGVLVGRMLAIYNAELVILGGMSTALLREVLPLVVGIFASGNVAVELASRIGAMSMANEIDALESMGHDPVAFTLGPPIVAILAASPLHMALATLAAVVGAAVPIHIADHLPWRELFPILLNNSAARALLTGMAKATVFAWLAFMVGATVGARPVRLPAEIGRRSGQAFTAGLIAIFAAAALWDVLM